MTAPAEQTRSGANEEPEITNEEAVPNDGRDVEGEKMMKEVVNKKLEQPPGEEKDSAD
ncbi:hypothetical protein ACSFA3_03410 [Variovorax sp. RHLX14]|uniref:hypothetical protein n=1 Tax=Variovorax sp. RHLX14 TaxID=1259731 RepID=UPI003F48B57E